MECPICLSTPSFPVKLNCAHVFCYLCIKGASYVNQRCPLCRKKIYKRFFNRPKLVLPDSDSQDASCQDSHVAEDDGEYVWFYSGRDGWWRYDESHGQQLEYAHGNGMKKCQLMIAGFMYDIDLEELTQVRQDNPLKKRNIRRDRIRDVISAKGIAGVSKKLIDNLHARNTNSNSSQSHANLKSQVDLNVQPIPSSQQPPLDAPSTSETEVSEILDGVSSSDDIIVTLNPIFKK